MKAEAGSWRIAELTLLMLACPHAGGLCRSKAPFRHKTRKQPFSSTLHGIAILQGMLLAIGGGLLLAS